MVWILGRRKDSWRSSRLAVRHRRLKGLGLGTDDVPPTCEDLQDSRVNLRSNLLIPGGKIEKRDLGCGDFFLRGGG